MRKAVTISFLQAIFLFASGDAYSQKIETIDGVRVIHNEKGGKWENKPEISIKILELVPKLRDGIDPPVFGD